MFAFVPVCDAQLSGGCDGHCAFYILDSAGAFVGAFQVGRARRNSTPLATEFWQWTTAAWPATRLYLRPTSDVAVKPEWSQPYPKQQFSATAETVSLRALPIQPDDRFYAIISVRSEQADCSRQREVVIGYLHVESDAGVLHWFSLNNQPYLHEGDDSYLVFEYFETPPDLTVAVYRVTDYKLTVERPVPAS